MGFGGGRRRTWAWPLLGLALACHEPDRLRALVPAAQVDEGLVDFGGVPVGEWREKVVHLRNVSSTPFRAQDVQRLLNSPCFTADLTPGPVSPGEVRPVHVRFHPLLEHPFEDRLHIRTDANQHPPGDVLIKGHGVPTVISVTPSALDFQTLEVNSDRSLSVQVVNPVDLPLSIQVAGQSAPQFTPSAAAVPPHATLTLTTRYAPNALGAAQARLLLRSCDGCTPTEVFLAGSSVPFAFTFDPAPMPFDDIPVHTSELSHAQATNVTWRPVSITGFSTDDGSFTPLDNPGAVVDPGASVQVHVQFAARSSGAKKGTLQLQYQSDRARAAPLELDASGGRPRLSLTPISIDFGELPVGGKVEATVRLTNAGTQGPLHFRGLAASGDWQQFGAEAPLRAGNALAWSGGTWPTLAAPDLPIQPGADHLDVKLAFAPLAPGDFSGTVGFLSDDLFNPSRPVVVTGRARTSGPCSWQLSPADEINFGNVPVGSGAVLGFRFQQVGGVECAVKDIHLSDDAGGAFFMPGGAIAGGVLHPTDAFSAQVAFKPQTSGSYHGTLQITVNDPAHPTAQLALVASAADSCLSAAPPYLDFGPIRYDCGVSPRSTYVSNHCTHPVTVTALTIGAGTSDQFSLITPPAPPIQLAPGNGFQVEATYARNVLGQHYSPLFISAAGEPIPYLVPLLAETNHEGLELDHFIQGQTNLLDVLFVVSNTTTMQPYQDRLAASLPGWIARARGAGVDLQVGVTTTGLYPRSGACPGGANGGEAGRLFPVDGSRPRIVPGQTPNAGGVLQGNVHVGTCHDLVQGLETLRDALSSPLIDHPDDPLVPEPNAQGNLGLLRPTARLAIVVLADEDDHSGFDPAAYTGFIESIKGPGMAQRVSLSAIVPTDARCATAGPPGPRFSAVATATGGQVESICDGAYDPTLDSLTANAQGLEHEFRLSAPPIDPNGIEVTVQGQLQEGAAYYYDPKKNAVVFNDGYVPQPGDEIDVRYKADCSVP